MQIFVKSYPSGTITLEVKEEDTIRDLKRKIFVKKGIPHWDQRIIIGGNNLNDSENVFAWGKKYEFQFFLVLRLEKPKPKPKPIFSIVPSHFSDIIICTETKDLPTVLIDEIESCLEIQELNVTCKIELINLRNVIVDVLLLNQIARLSSMNFMKKVSMQMKSDVFSKWLCEVYKIPFLPKQSNQDCSKAIEPIRNSLNKHIQICFGDENKFYPMCPIIDCIVNIHKRSGREMLIIVKLGHCDTVQTLKRIIWQKTGIPCKQQYLIKGNKTLRDNKQIMYYGKNTINLVLEEGGSPPIEEPKKPVKRKWCKVM